MKFQTNLLEMSNDFKGNIMVDDPNNEGGISMGMKTDFDWKKDVIEDNFTPEKITNDETGETITPNK